MKKRNKTIATVLTASLLAMSLTACGGESSSEDAASAAGSQTSDGTATASEDTSAKASETPSEGTQEIHKLTVLGCGNGSSDIKYDEREEYPTWWVLQDLLAEYGIELEIEVVPADQYDVVIQTRMASSDLPDIVNVSSLDDTTLVSMGQQGTILELSSLIEQYSDGTINQAVEERYPGMYGAYKTGDGKLYWITNCYQNTKVKGKNIGSSKGMQIRKDWLDAVGLDMPETLDEFTNALRTFREQDVNGSGQQDEIILVDCNSFSNGIAQAFGLGNGLYAIDTVTGKIVSPWYQDNIKEYFAYINGLVQEGLIDTATIGSDDLQEQRLATNLVSAWEGYDLATFLDAYVTDGTEGVDYEPVGILFDAAEGVTPWKRVEVSDLYWNRYAITKSCTDVEGAIKLLDMFFSPEYADIMAYGKEGENYEIVDGQYHVLDEGMPFAERGEKKMATGDMLWGGALPSIRYIHGYNTEQE